MQKLTKIILIRLSVLVFVFSALVAGGATISFTPNSISNTYQGVIQGQITGLTNGESVFLENYYDVNANGALDQPDLLMQRFLLTDGHFQTIGGVLNTSRPMDSTPTNGVISVALPYLDSLPQTGMGNHIMRVVSPYGNFSPVSTVVAITNTPFAQVISGKVTCTGTNVPYTVVVALDAQTEELAGMMVANASGNYSMQVPPGAYMVLGFRPGFLFSFGMAQSANVSTPGASATADVTLVPATQTISGTLKDKDLPGRVLGGVFLFVESASGLFTITTSDANGQFSVGVVSDDWLVAAESEALAPLGYVTPESQLSVSTFAGGVSGLEIKYPAATALIYGSIRDLTNGVFPGLEVWGSNQGDMMETSGWCTPSGDYCVPVTAGTWWVSPDVQDLPVNSIVGGADARTLVAGQAVRQDLLVVQATTTIRGTVKNHQGQPVPHIYVWGNRDGTVGLNANAETDLNGAYELRVADGDWRIGLQCTGNNGLNDFGYGCVNREVHIVIPPQNPVYNWVVYPIGTPDMQKPWFDFEGRFFVPFFGEPGTNYAVQYSTNPSDPLSWITFATVQAQLGMTTVMDPYSTNSSRFYRARIWP